MAITATVFQDAIVQVGKKYTFNDAEKRLSEYQVVQAFKDNAGDLLPESTIKALRTSDARTEKVPVLAKHSATVISSRSCTITPDTPTSALKTLVWVTVGFAVGITPSDMANNYISQEDLLAHQFQMGLKAVMASLDSSGYTALEANKTATFSSTLYTNASGAYQVPLAKKLDFYKTVPAVMRRHDFNGRVIDIANTEAIIDPMYIQAQGGGNSVNLNYQVQNFDFYRSNRVVTGSGVLETHYLLPQGGLGIYNWIDFESRNKIKIHNGKGWDTYVDPIMGFEWGVYYDHDCDAGKYKQKWNIVGDFAFVLPYASTTDTSVVKFELLNA